jgi:hypothetical protein
MKSFSNLEKHGSYFILIDYYRDCHMVLTLFFHKFCSIACGNKVHVLDVHFFGAILAYGSYQGGLIQVVRKTIARRRRNFFVRSLKEIINFTPFDFVSIFKNLIRLLFLVLF